MFLLDHSMAQETLEGGAQEGSEEGRGVSWEVTVGPWEGDA